MIHRLPSSTRRRQLAGLGAAAGIGHRRLRIPVQQQLLARLGLPGDALAHAITAQQAAQMPACRILQIQLHTTAIDLRAHHAASGQLLGIELPALLCARGQLALHRLPNAQQLRGRWALGYAGAAAQHGQPQRCTGSEPTQTRWW